MAVGTTPGITVDRHGQVIDKEHRGVRICARLGHVSSAKAQERLAAEIKRVEFDLERKANNRPRFAEGAARYLLESRDKRSVNVTAWHVRLLIPYIGTIELDRIHDSALQQFITDRVAQGG